MNKMTFLAVSVALALTGCGGGGGSDSSEPAASQGITITGFDGYFDNALMFNDSNSNGEIDDGEILGLTDENGQLELPADTDMAQISLVLQTLTPDGNVQSSPLVRSWLTEHAEGASTYTRDMDNPGQALAHEIQFRAPTSSRVISPVTDLVAIAMSNDSTLTEEAAKQSVALSLGLSEAEADNVYSDFVSGAQANRKLHKVAQILTESKVVAGDDYSTQATTIANAAQNEVNVMSDEQLESDSYKPVVTVTENGATAQSNYQLTVDGTAAQSLQQQLDALSITEDSNFSGTSLDLTGLFNDTDNTEPDIIVSSSSLGDSGIALNITNQVLTLGAVNPVQAGGEFTITLLAQDVDSQGQALATRIPVVLNVTIAASNQAPVIAEEAQQQLQSIIDNWQLQQGSVFEQTLSLAGLFSDADGEITEYESGSLGIDGLTLSIDQSQAIATISGTPTLAYPAGETLRITARDEDGTASEAAVFTLPQVLQGVEPPASDLHTLEGKTWYRLEHGSSNGVNTQNYSSVWCDSFRFENGVIYENERTPDNLTQCSAATTQVSDASYAVNGDNLVATFYDPDVGDYVDVTLSVSDASAISSGAQTLLWTVEEDGETETERYTFFTNKADAEARIQLKSDDDGDTRYFPMLLPTQNGGEAVGQVGLSINDEPSIGDSNSMDANVVLEFTNQDFTCEDAQDLYRHMLFTGADLNWEYSSGGNYDDNFECYNNEENNITHANIDFDLPSLSTGNVYSFISRVKQPQGANVEAIKFNMQWTGVSNND